MRGSLREPGALEAYVRTRRKVADASNPQQAKERCARTYPKSEQMLNKMAATFRDSNLPVPPEYQTESQKRMVAELPPEESKELYYWVADNFRIILGEPVLKQGAGSSE